MSPAWRTCSTSMLKSPIRSARWSVSTRVRHNSSARCASRSLPLQASSNVSTASISAMERPTCSSSSTCIDLGVRSKSLSADRQKTTLTACARSSTCIVRMPSASGLCRITYRPTQPAPSTRHSRPPKLGASCDGWSSITPPSTQVGSTWSRSRSECCAANASTDASTATSSSKPRSRPGNVSAMPQAPASNGCSQSTRPAPKWAGPTRSPLPYARAKPKSHNHCAALLDYHGSITLDPEHCEAAGIYPLEFVDIWNKNSGARISTYVVFGDRGSRCCILNGAAARTCQIGDHLIIAASEYIDRMTLGDFDPVVLTFHSDNSIDKQLLYRVRPTAAAKYGFSIEPRQRAPGHNGGGRVCLIASAIISALARTLT